MILILLSRGYIKRYRQIINTLFKYGFGKMILQIPRDELAEHLPIPKPREKKNQRFTKAERLRLALEELGPTFIKLGQFMSTRVDILPEGYIKELHKLQDQVQPISYESAKVELERELKHPVEFFYETFNKEPLAAASIGQVHRATLPSGETVAVKIRRPGIKEIVNQDLNILLEIASLLERYTNWGKVYRISEIVKEFKLILEKEMDFTIEGRNAERMKKNAVENKNIVFPKIYWKYTTQAVLTMEYVEGIKLSDLDILEKKGFKKDRIVKDLSDVFLKQVLIDGYFHGDPHPGNIFVLPGHKLFFLDFGIVGYLSPEQKNNLVDIILGFSREDYDLIIQSLVNMDIGVSRIEKGKLKNEIDRIHEKYFDVPLKNISIGETLQDLLEIAFKYEIRLPVEFTTLAKAFFTLESLLSRLDPEFSLAEAAKPFSKQIIKERFSPKRIKEEASFLFKTYHRFFGVFPIKALDFIDKSLSGQLKLNLEIMETDKFLKRISNMVNRLSFSIVLASLIIGLSLIIQFTEESLFRRFPLAEAGLIIAGFMGFWLLWAIIRSGRL